ncbi:MAG: GNVR domain-containing protein, partial [Desulfobacterales bacterium]
NSTLRPVFRATTTIIVDDERRRSPVSGNMIGWESYYLGALKFNTHFSLITSTPVLERVVSKLDMDVVQKAKFVEKQPRKSLIASFKENIDLLMGVKEKPNVVFDKMPMLVSRLKGQIQVEPVKDTRLLKITATDPDRMTAKNMADALADAYIEFNIENRLKSSRSTLSWMTDQLYEMKKKLEDAEEEFYAFKQQNKLFSFSGKQEMTAQKIAEFNNSYIQTRNRRLEIDSKLEELNPSSSEKVNILYARSVIMNPVIDELYSQLISIEMEHSQLGKVYKSKHPKMIQSTARLERARRKLHDEVLKEVENLRYERSMLFEKEKVLQKTIADFESESLQGSRNELKYTILQRNIETNQKLYDILLAKVQESSLIEDIDVSNIRIVEKAELPPAPIILNKRRNLLLGLIFGLVSAIGLVLFLEYIDRSLRTEEDVQRHLVHPVLSVVPDTNGHHANQKGGKKIKPEDEKFPKGLFLDNFSPNSRFSEAYRTLRTNLSFRHLEEELGSLLVTSAGALEGKTLTTANIAYSISQNGKSVLMIDADLRKPKLSYLGNPNQSGGLTGLLTDAFNMSFHSGDINTALSVSDLFRLATLQQKTGVLSLHGGGEEVDLVFLQGALVDVEWKTRPDEKKLASVLVGNAKITKEQAQKAIIKQRDTGQKLGFILINMGLLPEEDFKGPLTIHMMEGLRTALQIENGRFTFTDSPPYQYDRLSFNPIDVHNLYYQVLLGDEALPFVHKSVDSAVLPTETENLFLLPCGKIPPNPPELLGSRRMAFLTTFLEKKYDVVIADTPPLLPTTDALVLSSQVDGVLFVCRSGLMNRKMVIRSLDQLENVKANVLGVVLNRVNVEKEGYYKYYHKYYAQYYDK